MNPKLVDLDISQLLWQKGLGTFFSEEVPFSYSTGRQMASKVVQLLKQLSASLPPAEPLVILELGAGMGILAKNILDILKETDEPFYQRTVFYISENAERLINQIQQRQVFARHYNKVFFLQMNATEFKLPKNLRPLLIYLTYVLDALGARHIQLRNGVVGELCRRVSLPEKARVFDTTFFPPRLLRRAEILALRASSDLPRLTLLAPKIVKISQEEYLWQPVSDWADAEKEEVNRLLKYFPDAPEDAHFNYNRQIGELVNYLHSCLAANGCLLVLDFGYHQPIKLPEHVIPVAKFGALSTYPLFFGYLNFIASELGAPCFITENPDGQVQTWLLRKNSGTKFPAEIKDIFCQKDENKALDLYRQIELAGDFYTTNEAALAQILSSLTPAEQDSYFLLVNLAVLLLRKNKFAQAKFYAEKSLQTYSAVGIASYMVLGKIYGQQKNYAQAHICFEEILRIAPEYADAYNELALLFWEQKDFLRFETAARNYLKYVTSDENIWGVIFLLVIYYWGKEQKAESLRLLDWVLEIGRKAPEKIPLAFLIKAGALKKEILTPEPISDEEN